MAKDLLFRDEALLKIGIGVNKIADAVGVTMGPNGQNVIISRDGQMAITKDGVTVAKEVELEDYLENVGAQLIKQIAQKTAFEAGDGTTTSTILAASIFNNGMAKLTTGINPIEMKTGMELQTKAIIEALIRKSKPIIKGDTETLRNIATISANNDKELGDLIATAFETIGFKGVIHPQASKTAETSIEIVEGMQFDSGYVSPFFTMNEKSIVEFTKPMIFIFDGRINSFNDVFTYLEFASLNKSAVVFICDGIDIEALNAILVNCVRGNLQACIVKSPGFGDQKYNILNDIAKVTGSTVVSEKDGLAIRDMEKDKVTKYVGSCETIKIDAKSTSIIGGVGNTDIIETRVLEIEEAIKESSSATEKLILSERAAKLSNGVAIMKVGAKSDLELREKLDRIDDALSATRAAIEEGYIAGGGSVLYELSETIYLTHPNDSQKIGADIINSACKSPLATIIKNSGRDIVEILNRLDRKYDLGYNAKTDKVENLIESGVIDPVKVTRCSLENALSVASLILTTGCMMVEKPIDLLPKSITV